MRGALEGLNKMRRFAIGCVLVSALVSAGCGTKGKCGEGTVQHGKGCYPYNPNDSTPPEVTVDPPERTREVGNVTLTANELATIYYTTDGSLPTESSAFGLDVALIPDVPDDGIVRYFAVDLAGNASAVTTATWTIDREGPGRPRNFSLGVAGDARTLSWEEPFDQDLMGVLVARVEGRLARPEGGVFYSAGDELAPGVTVVAVVPAGEPGAFSESQPVTPGLVRYAAWSFDDLGNYGAAAGGHELVSIPPQTGVVTVNVQTGAVTVSPAPSLLGVTGTATYDATGMALDIELSVENLATRVLFAPKVVATNLSGTTGFWDNLESLPDTGEDYRDFKAAIAPGQTVSRTLRLGGVAPLDVVSFEIEVRDNPVLVAPLFRARGADRAAGVADPVAARELLLLAKAGPAFGPDDAHCFVGGAVTMDGRVIFGSRNSGRLTAFDLTTGGMSGGSSLGSGHVPTLAIDGSGLTGFAVFASGVQRRVAKSGSGSTLVRFDVDTLVETGRVEIGSSRNRSIAISPDGSLVAIGTGLTETILVDADSLQITQRIPVGASAALFTPDGSLVTITNGSIRVFGVSQGLASQTAQFPNPLSSPQIGAALYAGDRLWIGARNNDGAVAVDLTDGSSVDFSGDWYSMVEVDGAIWAGGYGDTIRQFDFDGDQLDSIVMNRSFRGRGVTNRSPF